MDILKNQDIKINNTSISSFGVKAVLIEKPFKPKLSYSTTFVPMLYETIYNTSGYEDIEIGITFAFKGTYEETMAKMKGIIDTSLVETTIEFNSSGKVFKGKLLEEVALPELEEVYYTFKLTYMCSPFATKNRTVNLTTGNNAVTYNGNIVGKPVFTIDSTNTITIGDKHFTLTTAEEIKVDCRNKIVYKGNFVNCFSSFLGDFLELQSGNNTINVTANCSMQFDEYYLYGGELID